MRMMVISAGALIVGAFALGHGSAGANAFPQPPAETAKGAQAVTTVGWRRRYWRRYGRWPNGPRVEFDDGAYEYDAYEDGAYVTTDRDIVIIAPRRPRSCGKYRYWNGFACVDARYNDPYLGPK